ncbi:cysteine desulfurase [Brucella pseudogrignonensis]|uniref:Cysteine desulfurase n=1 Tax=Brucella pseudogrignonensis TaxID=419475 RepID=A0A256GF16_9HYPH|nr:cysteine desulfurase family protein [Brucella pseudogrignonensis]EMG54620.1 cysteine desulfurase [Ochrobactrum sp. CDB2]MQP38584.1 aminotransferase class V-fold PLP-dependent enzyme [Ochrobactrum sp. MYb237]MCD4511402.1 cysteine desulfurase [Brucella pseudogrignonensis]NNV23737.1 cysteine desulfurase [Brucella pseudogrignonensis]OYR25211.1 beta-eliminating lyase family protein [Brucella pseudogrignonensis]
MIGTGKRLYLDYNASAPLLDEARNAVIEALGITGNPSSVHREGRAARALVESARRSVAALVNAKPEHVFFTSGATEAASTLLTPIYMMGRSPVRLSHLYVSATEHPCMLAGGQFAPDNITVLPVDENGILRLDALEQALKAHDKSAGLPLVAVQAANNETGVIQPIREIAALVKTSGGIFVVDAVQAAGRIKIDITEGCGDYLIISSHKIGGPKGVGAVIAISDLMMPKALVRGGGQEKGHRAGTEALPLIAGFGAAADVAATRLNGNGWSFEARDRLETGLMEIAPSATIHGKSVDRLPNTTFFSLDGQKAETVQIAFDLGGIALSAGSACSSGKVGPSHVLAAMGLEEGPGAIRVSLEPNAPIESVDQFLDVLRKIVARHERSKAS